MTIHYNRSSEKNNRRRLRANCTLAEEILWEYLRDNRICNAKFRRQYSVGKYIFDFYSPRNKLAIELDGDIHNEPEVAEHDQIRDEYLKRFGIKILRIKNEEVHHKIGTVIKLIEMNLKQK